MKEEVRLLLQFSQDLEVGKKELEQFWRDMVQEVLAEQIPDPEERKRFLRDCLENSRKVIDRQVKD